MARRIFISAATREFGAARDRLANGLRSRNVIAEVQSAFRQTDDTTLAKLHDYICKCDRVLALIGKFSGAFPPEGAVTEAMRAMLPDGMERASYTQWEVIFARHYGIQTFLFDGTEYTAEGDPAPHDEPAAQAAWRDLLFDGGWGLERRAFASKAELRAEVMELDWPNIGKPSNLWRSIGRLFKGREEFLAKIEQSFRDNAATAIVGTAMHGLGGVGKTRAAIEYGHAHQDDYSALFFLVGKSPNDLLDGLADLCGVLQLEQKDAPDLGIRVAAVINWMKANPGWFLVIDNVDDPAAANAVREFLDQVANAKGHVLITSRLDDWGFGVEPLQLDLLSIEAAMEVLREATPHRTRTSDEDTALARLADEQLGCLSLALVQAAAYIQEWKISFAEYSEEFDKQAATVLARFGETEAGKLAYPMAVAQTWLVSFEQLGEEARLLLDMLAWLSIEPLPRGLWNVWPQADEIDLKKGLTQLARYSFVRWEDGNTAITMHRLVQEVARDLQSRNESRRDAVLEALFAWLMAANTELSADDPRSWPILLPLLPHVLRLFGRTKHLGPFAEQASVYGDAGLLLCELARYEEAEAILRMAVDRCEIRADARPIDVATALFNLADLLRHLDQRIEARDLCRRALAITIAAHGKDHPVVAKILNVIARLHRKEGRFSAAKRMFQRAIRIIESHTLEEQGDHAALCNNLGSLLEQQGIFQDAESLYRRATSISEKFYGLNHLITGVYYNNLAGVLMVTNRLDDAAELYRRSVVILLNTSKQCGHVLPNLRTGVMNYRGCLTKQGLTHGHANQLIDELMSEAGFNPSHLWKQIYSQPPQH